MTTAPVSVVIPCYNHARYLEHCLKSVFEQTYARVEIILLDDGSTDDSVHIARDLKPHSPFEMTIIEQDNRGAHATINRGVRMAKGRYVNILNSDDYFHSERLARCVAELQAHGSEFGFTKVGYVDQLDRDVSFGDPYAADLVDKQDNIPSYITVGYSLIESNVTISTGNFFFTKALFDAVGDFDALMYCHDWDFVLRALLHTEPVYINDVLYYYRLHEGNSFRNLGSVAGYECPYLMRKFFSLGRGRAVPNRLAPTAINWGEYFWTFIARINYWPYLVKAA